MSEVNDPEPAIEASPVPGTHIVMSVQYLLAAAYLLGAGGILLTAAMRTGNYEGLLSPGLEQFDDPKVWIPPFGPDSVWNPLAWIFGLARAVSLFIVPLAAIAGLVGLVCLFRTDARGQRRTFTSLLVGTVACLALVAFTATPYGAQLQNWLLD
jgi:hypothetical protein